MYDAVLLKTVDDSTAPLLRFASANTTLGASYKPTWTIDWTPRTGEQGFDTFWTKQLSDRSEISVNVDTGNLIVHGRDVNLQSALLNLGLDRYYNSRSAYVGTGAVGSGYSTNRLGAGWSLSIGNDVWLEPVTGGNIVFHGPTGFSAVFPTTGTNAWSSPPGQNADLTFDGSVYRLRFQQNGITYRFANTGPTGTAGIGVLNRIKESNGNLIDVDTGGTSYANRTITGTLGDTVTFNTAGGYLNGLTLASSNYAGSASRTYGYGLNSTTHKLETYTDPTSAQTAYSYNATSGLLEQIDTPTAGGNIERTRITYDSDARATRVERFTDAAHTTSLKTDFSYTQTSTTVTDPRGLQTTYNLDSSLRTEQVVDSAGRNHDQTWNPNGDRSSFSDAHGTGTGNIRTLQYDATTNALTSVENLSTDPGTTANPTTLSYTGGPVDFPFLPTQVTDPQGNQTSYSYDSTTGMLKSTTDQLSTQNTMSQTTKGVDGVTCTGAKDGQLCSRTGARSGTTTNYAYNNGLLVTITPPSTSAPSTQLGATTLGYDANNRVASITDGKGQITRYSFDGNDRITKILYNSTTSCDLLHATCTEFVYDPTGNLMQRKDATGTWDFTFDLLNRTTGKTNTLAGESDTATYDAADNILSETVNGFATNYTYKTNLNLVDTIREPGVSSCGTSNVNCFRFTYDNNDRITRVQFPNGVDTNLTLGKSGRPTTITGNGAAGTADVSYTWTNPADNTQDTQLLRTRTDATTSPSSVTTYTYDQLNRLTDAETKQATTSTERYQYTLDGDGNLTQIVTTIAGTATTENYSYNQNNQVCTNTATCSGTAGGFTYDANGNQTAGGGHTSYAYNTKNQTTTVDGAGNYAYDDVGQTERTAGDSNTYANWLDGHQYTKTGLNSTVYVRHPSGLLLSARYFANGLGNGVSYYFHVDPVTQNVLQMTNGTGSKVAGYSYDPYGKTDNATGSYTNPYRYKSGYKDNSGMYHYGDRYYNPTQRRWTQQDSVAGQTVNPNTMNRYNFVGSQPITQSDPSGRDWQDWVDAAADIAGMVSAGTAIFCAFGVLCGITLVTGGISLIGNAVVGDTGDAACAAGTLAGGVLSGYYSAIIGSECLVAAFA